MDIKKVYYKHYRYPDRDSLDSYYISNKLYGFTQGQTKYIAWKPSTKGGRTECHLVFEDDTEIIGIAECSLKDNFNYKIGREISYGRAMKKYYCWLEQIASQKADWFYTTTCTE